MCWRLPDRQELCSDGTYILVVAIDNKSASKRTVDFTELNAGKKVKWRRGTD